MVAWLSETDSDIYASYWTMTITAIALFVSAIVLLIKNGLPFFLALSVSILLWLHAFAALFVLLAGAASRTAQYTNRSARLLRLQGFSVMAIATVFSTFVWSDADTNEYENCENETQVFVMAYIKVSSGWTGAVVFLMGLILYLVLSCMFVDVIVLIKGRAHPQMLDYGFREGYFRFLDPYISMLFLLAHILILIPYSVVKFLSSEEQGVLRRLKCAFDFLGNEIRFFLFGYMNRTTKPTIFHRIPNRYVRLFLIFFTVVVVAMLILSNELTIHANVNLVGGNFDSSWAIGQVRVLHKSIS